MYCILRKCWYASELRVTANVLTYKHFGRNLPPHRTEVHLPIELKTRFSIVIETVAVVLNVQ